MRKSADELVSLAPDVLLANSSAAISPLLQATRVVPIVFAAVADAVGAGYVETLARPGGNATGFTAFEYSDHYEVKVDGAWMPVPSNKINNVIAPDGGAHICAPKQEGVNKGVLFCVVLPPDG